MLDIQKFDEHVSTLFPKDGFYYSEWRRIKTALVEAGQTAPNKLKAEIRALLCEYDSYVSDNDMLRGPGWFIGKLRELSAV